jgi:hypothetical protein
MWLKAFDASYLFVKDRAQALVIDEVKARAWIARQEAVRQSTDFSWPQFEVEVVDAPRVKQEIKPIKIITQPEVKSEVNQEVKPLKVEQFTEIECRWCHEKLPSNGAAQFSHLRKHVNELIRKGDLTMEQATTIRRVKLEPNIETIFISKYQ